MPGPPDPARGSALNRASYDRIAAEWDRARAAFFGPERGYLDALLDGLPVPSMILDMGCGTGRPMAEEVLARGHRVTGVDQSSELLAIARARFPQATWIESRLEEVELPGRYAGAICWDSLFHIDRALHTGILARVAASLHPDGRLMMTVGGSEHPAFTDTMFGQEFFYDSHPPERALAILDELGFEPLVAELINPPVEGGDKGRYAVVARLARS